MPERVPRLVANVDVRKFKLDPTDGFLLTRIDGRLGLRDLARETGLPDFSVERAIEKMEKLGIIEIVEPGAPPKAAAAPPADKKPELPRFTASLSGPKYDLVELEEPADLSIELKKRVLDLYYRLEDMDHYTLLGVTREADKKTIKRAYFELAATMHPDKYFNKKLGSFKTKMEVLFGRVTEAHDVLVHPAKRAEYDAYLAEVATTRGMEAMLERALAESRPAEAPVPAPPPSVPPPPSARSSAPGPSPDEIRMRKEALARRLLGGSGRPPPAPSSVPAPPSPLRFANANDAVDALKRRYDARIESATTAQSKKYVDAAEEAFAKNDLAAAAQSLGFALKLTPNDTALAARYAETKERGTAQLTESYTKQAVYEERAGHWTEAARSWERVARLTPNDARAHERAAHALLRAPDGDLRVAADHAKQAIAVEPRVVAHHVTLAEIYAKAGLASSAKRAAELGLTIEPENKALHALLKRGTKT